MEIYALVEAVLYQPAEIHLFLDKDKAEKEFIASIEALMNSTSVEDTPLPLHKETLLKDGMFDSSDFHVELVTCQAPDGFVITNSQTIAQKARSIEEILSSKSLAK